MYSINLNLQQAKCVVIGGGHVALRKVLRLLQAQANIEIIAPLVEPELQEIIIEHQICYHARKVHEADFRNARLIICAVGDSEVNRFVVEQANKYNCLLNVVDEPALGNFIVPAQIEVDNLLLTVSTSGKSPALARVLKERLEHTVHNYAIWLETVERLRMEVKVLITSSTRREQLWRAVLSDEIMQLVEQGEFTRAEEELRRAISRFGTES